MKAKLKNTARVVAKTTSSTPTAANSPALPQLFTAQSLARYLGVPVGTVHKLKLPRLVLGHRTKLFALKDVLARVDELKKVGTA